MVPVRSSMTPVWRRNASSIFSTSAATACEMSTRLPAIVSICVAIWASISRRASASLPRSSSRALAIASRPSARRATWLATTSSNTARPSATFCRSACSALDRVSRPSAIFCTWPATNWSTVERASASLSRSACRARVRMSRPCASFSTCPATRPSMPLRLSASFVEVVFQRLGEHVAALGELLHLAGDEGVDGARLTATLLRSASSALVRMSRPSAIFSPGWRRSCRCWRAFRLVSPGKRLRRASRPSPALHAGNASSRASASLLRSASSARFRMSRPSASFSTWPATRPSMLARLCASFQGRPPAPWSGRRGRRRTSRHGFRGDR